MGINCDGIRIKLISFHILWWLDGRPEADYDSKGSNSIQTKVIAKQMPATCIEAYKCYSMRANKDRKTCRTKKSGARNIYFTASMAHTWPVSLSPATRRGSPPPIPVLFCRFDFHCPTGKQLFFFPPNRSSHTLACVDNCNTNNLDSQEPQNFLNWAV